MANSPDFVAHAVELLSSLERVEARRMFGGHGVYARGVMFGLLDDDELFLKTDELSRPRFVEAGCRRWVYVGPTQKMENTSYFRPPDGAHEDPEAMLPWARLALDAALRLAAAKARKAARPKKGKLPARAKAGSSSPRRPRRGAPRR
jgi:DNA transformation protein and related proteins